MHCTTRSPRRGVANVVHSTLRAGWFVSVAAALRCSSSGATLNQTAPPETGDAEKADGGAAGADVDPTADAGGNPSSDGTAGAAGNQHDVGASPRTDQDANTDSAGAGDTLTMTTAAGPKIPPLPATCPELKTGSVTVMGQQVTLWVGTKQAGKKGPLMFYWHGTGTQPDEAVSMLGPVLDEIQAAGGLVASFSTTLGTGTNAAVGVWYTDDFEMADAILACAVAQLDIDTRRIYSAGCSPGGMEAATMAFSRSSYLAGSMPDDGGVLPLAHITDLEDPSHVPSLITAYGGPGANLISFEETSTQACQAVKDAGGFAASCKYDAGGNCGRPLELLTAQWQFLKDHPFGTTTDPYTSGLPASFPASCTPFL